MNVENWTLLGGYLVGASYVFVMLLSRGAVSSRISWIGDRVAAILDAAINAAIWPLLAVKFLLDELR